MSLKRARTMSFGGGMSQISSSQSYGASGGSRMPRKVAGFRSTRSAKGKRPKRVTVSSMRAIARQEIMANQEVKTLDESAEAQSVAQITNNATGHNTWVLGMTPAQGAGARQRIGDAILLDRLVINGSYYKQTNAGSAINLVHYLVAFKGSLPTVAIADLFDGSIALDAMNAGVQIYDTNVLRNPSYESTIKIMATWKVHVPASVSLDSGNEFAHASSQTVVDLKGQRMEYDGLSGAKSNVVYGLITVADAGNRGGSVSTLNGIPATAVTSGVSFNMGVRMFFRDA